MTNPFPICHLAGPSLGLSSGIAAPPRRTSHGRQKATDPPAVRTRRDRRDRAEFPKRRRHWRWLSRMPIRRRRSRSCTRLSSTWCPGPARLPRALCRGPTTKARTRSSAANSNLQVKWMPPDPPWRAPLRVPGLRPRGRRVFRRRARARCRAGCHPSARLASGCLIRTYKRADTSARMTSTNEEGVLVPMPSQTV